MNYLIIILGIILVLMIYYIYLLMTGPPVIASNLYLKDKPPPIPAEKISNPTSINYTVGVWIYINNFSSDIGKFLNFGSTGSNLFALKMDPVSPKLSVDIQGTNDTNTIVITNNFPIQSWTYVTVSVSSDYTDLYINGKLVVSSKLTKGIKSAGIDTPQFSFSTSSTGPDIYLTGLARWDKPLDPQSIFTYYRAGNGNSNGLFGSKYNIDVLMKRDSSTYKYSVF